ncbi:hypothetical protein B0H14DRAFT_2804860, partial [Mycena olivaceomarginata]
DLDCGLSNPPAGTQCESAATTNIGILVRTLDRSGSVPAPGSVHLHMPSAISSPVRIPTSLVRLTLTLHLRNLYIIGNKKLTFDWEPTMLSRLGNRSRFARKPSYSIRRIAGSSEAQPDHDHKARRQRKLQAVSDSDGEEEDEDSASDAHGIEDSSDRDSLPESDGRRDDSDSDSDDDPMQNHMRPALLHLLSTAHPTSRAGLPNADIALRVPGNVNLGDGGAVAVFCDLPRTSPSILGPVQASNQLFRRTTVIPCVVLLLALPSLILL